MTNYSIAFDPFLPWPVIWIALALAVLLSGIIIALRTRGSILRALAFLALAIALANPVISQEDRTALPTSVAIIVDESQSQRLDGRTETTAQAVERLTANFERYDQFDVRVIETARTETANTQTETRLFEALRSVFRDVPPARIGGAVFITDGQVHDVPNISEALGFDAPVHALITGHPDEYDRKVQLVETPRFAIVGDPVQVSYRIEHQGDVPQGNENVEVSIYRNGELLAIEQALANETFEAEIELDRSGKNIIEFATDEIDGELTGNNNRAVVRIEGIRENLRVLLVSGEPHSGERTWRNLLKSDASVDLVHFTILRPPEKQDGTPINELSLIAFPTRELFVERIEDFDLIVFDRYQNRNVLPVLYYDYIAEYVRNGGALLIAAGDEYAGDTSVARTPLFNALPAVPTGQVQMAGYYPRISDDGKRHPVTRDLPGGATEPPNWGRWFRTVDVQDVKGTTIMQAANDKPLLVLDEYGEGRVGLMLSDHGWLWARGFEGGGPHVNLYRRLAHWLMKEPDLEAEALTAEPDGQALKVSRQTMADAADAVTIIAPDGQEIILELQKTDEGLFEGTYETNQIGLFEISDATKSTLAHIGPINAPEFRDMISTADILKPYLDEVRGDTRRLLNDDGDINVPNILPIRSNVETSGRDWIGFKMTKETELRGINRQGVFAGFLGLGLLLLAFSAMWYREGK
ncbi:membrane protein [Ahrensia sp. 13_GOM-1096m]|uniref:membrane protein n=1 Tax=Ahrensia sp. 13_GOM-1096m TaxID=1380380 RepID=UPI00047D7D03|nr:membrane protein [Ahrensia sp. 13_GOM-1096m]